MAVGSVSGVRQRRKRFNYGYLFVLPYVLLLLCFGIGPSLYAILISFTDSNSDALSFNGLTTTSPPSTIFVFLHHSGMPCSTC